MVPAISLLASALIYADPPKTGTFTLSFSERSPHSALAEIGKRLGPNFAPKGKNAEDYELASESFEIYVPKSYSGKKAFGLLVFVSPGPNGGVKNFDRDGGWTKALDEREIIWVGPNKAGNERAALHRLGLALDAAHNAVKEFKIDPERVYMGGVSGGGRVTSMLAIPFPDVFRGGYAIIGANFYRNIKSQEQAGMHPGLYKAPSPKLLSLAKQRRHVFLTGDTDANREHMHLIFQALVKDGWKHCQYFQVPRMGHSPPDGEWFAKGLAALDGEAEAPNVGKVTGKQVRNPQGRKSEEKQPDP